MVSTYCLSHKTVNTIENFWNIMFIGSRRIRCQMKPQKINRTNRSRDKSWLDSRQPSGPFFYEKSSIFPWTLSEKAILPQTNTSHLIPSVQKPNYRTDRENCENLQRYRFASWLKVSQLQEIRIENHQSQSSSMAFWTARETNTEEHCFWLLIFLVLRRAV